MLVTFAWLKTKCIILVICTKLRNKILIPVWSLTFYKKLFDGSNIIGLSRLCNILNQKSICNLGYLRRKKVGLKNKSCRECYACYACYADFGKVTKITNYGIVRNEDRTGRSSVICHKAIGQYIFKLKCFNLAVMSIHCKHEICKGIIIPERAGL